MDKAIKVAIVEDIADIRESLQTLIAGMPGFCCSEIYATAEQAIANIREPLPDVVLMDINLPGISGVEAVKQLKDTYPGLNFLMCTVFDDEENIFQALRAGANGYILKNNSPLKILEAIRDVYEGGSPMSASIARSVINSFHTISSEKSTAHASLSAREVEVLQLLSKGLLYKEAAAKLDLSVETIRSHCRKIYEKLHVNSKLEAINLVFRKK